MKFDDLIETIDLLDAEQVAEVVDWQLTKSLAAKTEGRGECHVYRDDFNRAGGNALGSAWIQICSNPPMGRELPPRPVNRTELQANRVVHIPRVTMSVDWGDPAREPGAFVNVEMQVVEVEFTYRRNRMMPTAAFYGIRVSSVRGVDITPFHEGVTITDEYAAVTIVRELFRHRVMDGLDVVLELDNGRGRAYLESSQ